MLKTWSIYSANTKSIQPPKRNQLVNSTLWREIISNKVFKKSLLIIWRFANWLKIQKAVRVCDKSDKWSTDTSQWFNNTNTQIRSKFASVSLPQSTQDQEHWWMVAQTVHPLRPVAHIIPATPLSRTSGPERSSTLMEVCVSCVRTACVCIFYSSSDVLHM